MAKKQTKKPAPTKADVVKFIEEANLVEMFDDMLFNHSEGPYGKFYRLMEKVAGAEAKKEVAVPGFVVTKEDLLKITSEVEGSCLTAKAKAAIKAAVKEAK